MLTFVKLLVIFLIIKRCYMWDYAHKYYTRASTFQHWHVSQALSIPLYSLCSSICVWPGVTTWSIQDNNSKCSPSCRYIMLIKVDQITVQAINIYHMSLLLFFYSAKHSTFVLFAKSLKTMSMSPSAIHFLVEFHPFVVGSLTLSPYVI